MSGYLLADVTTVKDPGPYERYQALVPPSLRAFNGTTELASYVRDERWRSMGDKAPTSHRAPGRAVLHEVPACTGAPARSGGPARRP